MPLTANDVCNALLSREALARAMNPTHGKVDVDKECGYPDEITIDDYYRMWKRNGVARKVTAIHAEETWKQEPDVYEDEDPDVETPFEAAWNLLNKQKEILSVLALADVLSGIGRFGVILLGIGDGGDLEKPVKGFVEYKIGGPPPPDTNTRNALLYMRPLSEKHVTVADVDRNSQSERYLQPTVYKVKLADPNGSIAERRVHWTRVFHLADGRDENAVFGTPRMESVYNYLLDLRKLGGGSAQMFWQGAHPGTAFKFDPGIEEYDAEAIKEEMEAYTLGLQRYLAIVGAEAKSLAPQVADPAGHVDVQLTLISTSKGIPKRKLMGSERGELASSQDSESWDEQIVDRRLNYGKPKVLIPFAHHLISCRVLPPPAPDGEVIVDWLPPSSLSEQEMAEVADKRVTALAKYVTSGLMNVIPFLVFLTVFLGMEQEEAEMVAEASEDLIEEYKQSLEDAAEEEDEEETGSDAAASERQAASQARGD